MAVWWNVLLQQSKNLWRMPAGLQALKHLLSMPHPACQWRWPCPYPRCCQQRCCTPAWKLRGEGTDESTRAGTRSRPERLRRAHHECPPRVPAACSPSVPALSARGMRAGSNSWRWRLLTYSLTSRRCSQHPPMCTRLDALAAEGLIGRQGEAAQGILGGGVGLRQAAFVEAQDLKLHQYAAVPCSFEGGRHRRCHGLHHVALGQAPDAGSIQQHDHEAHRVAGAGVVGLDIPWTNGVSGAAASGQGQLAAITTVGCIPARGHAR